MRQLLSQSIWGYIVAVNEGNVYSAIVSQGGGALGAYEYGVLKA